MNEEIISAEEWYDEQYDEYVGGSDTIIYSTGWGIYICEKCKRIIFEPFINHINVTIPCECGNVAILEDIVNLSEVYEI